MRHSGRRVRGTAIKKRQQQLGFTIIELMIAVAIISLLAAMAIPNYYNFTCKAKQSEAKEYLGLIARCEEAYFIEYNTYGADKDKIGFYTIGHPRYSYQIVSADQTGFVAEASSYYSDRLDTWIINNNFTLSNDPNGCTRE